MTWLEGIPDGDTDWDRLAALFPEIFDAMAGTLAAACEDTDPELVELARLRIAKLLNNTMELEPRRAPTPRAGRPALNAADVAAWPTSPRFTAAERACLALAEQFVMDANGVTDELVAEVTEHLGGARCFAFVQTVSVLETFQRACLTLGIRTAPGLDEIMQRAHQAHTTTEVSQ
jgi:alkylhydroperoxidase family enzyme